MNGRATVHPANEMAYEGKLGDVYDKEGHLVYDKDYLSRMEVDDGDSSMKEGSVNGSIKSKPASSNNFDGPASALSSKRQQSNAQSSSQRPSVMPSAAASNTI